MHQYKFPRAALTVDAVIFASEKNQWFVLCITRGKAPFEGQRAFPGGFFDLKDESTEAAARRELREETGCEGDFPMKLVGVFSRPDRDPRERVVSHAYTAVLPERHPVKGADDAASAEWIEVEALADPKQWAFDHYEVLVKALAVHGYGSPA
jgi:8-oxo-dGTP diphosphatase